MLKRTKISKDKGIWAGLNTPDLSIDESDCLDPAYASGTGTPQFGGLYSWQLLNVLRGIVENYLFWGFMLSRILQR